MTKIFVVVPFYNEEKLLPDLIASFKQQTDQHFFVIYVDNTSTDASVRKIHEAQKHAKFSYEIISEEEKGTGYASDTGFRYAITHHHAEHIARTDADCRADRDWIRNIRKGFMIDKLEFIGGRSWPMENTFFMRILVLFLIGIMDCYGKLFFGIWGYKYSYFLVAGHNLAITSDLYIRSGGFPRTSLDTTNEDLVLSQAVRKLTKKSQRCSDVIMYHSTRRLRDHGFLNLLFWYKNRSYKPKIIDVR